MGQVSGVAPERRIEQREQLVGRWFILSGLNADWQGRILVETDDDG